MKFSRTINAILSLSAIALVIAIAGCGSSKSESSETPAPPATQSTGAAGSTVAMKLTEMKIDTPNKKVKAGKVNFTAVNNGNVVHEVIVIKTDKQAGDLGKGSTVSEDGSVGEIPEVKPGKSGQLTVDLKPGHYALICNVPGHYAAGMYTDLTVQ